MTDAAVAIRLMNTPRPILLLLNALPTATQPLSSQQCGIVRGAEEGLQQPKDIHSRPLVMICAPLPPQCTDALIPKAQNFNLSTNSNQIKHYKAISSLQTLHLPKY